MKMFTKANLSKVIKDFRKENNLTQKEFSEIADVSLRAIIKLENLDTVNVETVTKCLKAAECELVISKTF